MSILVRKTAWSGASSRTPSRVSAGGWPTPTRSLPFSNGETFLSFEQPDSRRGEAIRRFRVLDFMLSAHSILRDRMRRRAVALDLALFAVAIALCATAL